MLEKIKNLYRAYQAHIEEQKRIEREEDVLTRVNVKRRDGIDYIIIDGIEASMSTDTDILERLNSIRERYLAK